MGKTHLRVDFLWAGLDRFFENTFFFTFSPTLDASILISLLQTLAACTVRYMQSGRNEGRSKSIFLQLRINTLW